MRQSRKTPWTQLMIAAVLFIETMVYKAFVKNK